MPDLPTIQQELRAALPKKGVSFLIKSLKGLLPEGTPKYDVLINLEAEYRQLKLDVFSGIMSTEQKNLREAQLRKRILDMVSGLEASDFDASTEHSALADKQKIRRGHVLYRIPQEMQLQEESRCLVRIAFDKAMIVEDLDLDEDTELRSEVRISDYMKVEIADPSPNGVFAIRTTSEEVQFIDEDDFTEWHFYVKPLQAGQHRLELKVSVILRINGEDRVREKTLEESVVVITEAPDSATEEQAFFQMDETLVLSDTLETAIAPPSEVASAVSPVAPPAPGPVPPPAPKAQASRSGSKSSGNRFRNLGMVLMLLIGFGFAFNLLLDAPSGSTDNPISGDIDPDDVNGGGTPQEADLLAYLEDNPYGPAATNALWQLAQSTELPEDYLAYVNNVNNMGFYPSPEDEDRILEAQQIYSEQEQEVWDKASTNPNLLQLDRYLRLYPEGRFREMAISQLASAETWNNKSATDLPERWQADTLNWQYRLLSYAEESQNEQEQQLIKQYAATAAGRNTDDIPQDDYYERPKITKPESIRIDSTQ